MRTHTARGNIHLLGPRGLSTGGSHKSGPKAKHINKNHEAGAGICEDAYLEGPEPVGQRWVLARRAEVSIQLRSSSIEL